jgi:glucose-6-phosphate isomerase
VSVKNNNSALKIPPLNEYGDLVDNIQGKSFKEVMGAILLGVKASYRKGKMGFIDIEIPNKKAFTIGALLQFKMMEMMYLGFLLGVNPFNQPDVEKYKRETRRILGG